LPDGTYSSIIGGGTNFGVTFPASGARNNSGKLEKVGSSGDYWSGSANSDNNNADAYRLSFNTTSVVPKVGISRGYGFPVRCVKND
jgi:uncharacterized protein (TIGR02145 family)